MELDDFKKDGRSPQVPEFTGEKTTTQPMETLIGELKALDSKHRKMAGFFIIFFGMFVAVYSSSFALHQGGMKTGFLLLVVGFIIVLGYSYWRYRRIKNVDYTAPTTVFLRDAEQRYRFMTPVDWLITVPMLILFITGGSIVVHSTYTRYFGDSLVPLFIYLGIMVMAVAFGFWASYKNWERDKGWMLKKILETQKAFGI